MTLAESMARFEVGMRVYDRWWVWDVGVVERKGKTRLRIRFPTKTVSYDASHSKFLERARPMGVRK